ncbi:MAG: hypothetical protein Q4P20_04405 [Eubacteriales bacterium]|nr:hypothetical protein [Eubacteriales bacterium]
MKKIENLVHKIRDARGKQRRNYLLFLFILGILSVPMQLLFYHMNSVWGIILGNICATAGTILDTAVVTIIAITPEDYWE